METQNSTKQSRRMDKRAFLGLIFILIGGIFLLHNYNLIPQNFTNIIFKWEMILIIIGAYNLLTKRIVSGIILIGIGSFFLIPDIFVLPNSFKELFWPVFLIIVGLAFILRKRGSSSGNLFNSTKSSIDYIDDLAIFGGGEKYITSQKFIGGRITAIFGGSTFILKDAKLAEGVNKIDVLTMFGGSKLIVPDDWNIKVEVVSIFGGFKDKRRTFNNNNSYNNELVVKGFVVFGGGEISN
ncbi:MAG: hypothetical protein IMY72_01105 [Bacteroidetes bacterium]|nr:hypothetical protein [Bacteroidota bacterium]